MKQVIVIFCAIISSRAQILIYPDQQYDKISKPENLFGTSPENKSPALHDIFPQYWSDHVTNIISRGITKFALDMDDAIYKNSNSASKKRENIVFSPLSLAGTMAIVLLASGGHTFDEVAKILGLESGVDVSGHSEVVHEMFGLLIGMVGRNKNNPGPQATYANGIFIQEGYPIRPEFRAINQKVYKSEIINVDFHNHGEEAKEIVNNWVNSRTKGKITKILSSIPNPETDVILASALYFNGEWDQYFIDSATMRKPFTIEPGETVTVDMMYNGADFPFYEDKKLGVKILGLPYKGLEVTMYVLLPNRPGATALKEFERNLDPNILENLINNVKNQTCIVGFPKMKLSSSLSLKRAFQSLGLITLFDPRKADLSLLSAGLNNSISKKNIDDDLKSQLPKPQDGFYFPPRIGDTDQDNKTTDNGNLKRKYYFRYEDMLRGYSVEQWDNGFNIKRNRRSTNDEFKSIKNMNKRKKRQNRPIDQDFLNFLNSQNLPSFGLDSLRNSKNIQNPGLYAEDILHRVEIDINEKGTEAAAATAVAIERTGSQRHFVANRPFLFFIRHDFSKLIWFWGTVNSPTPNFR
ncbi:leukocyte elastase inhibitor-like isoform X2 [Leptopilina boulardi]|uniref:leukocyte elastase inhibitor-like isoform X2 n=1 Tax=Leptopilina boulardi TaxID=63433 RepID=UPI0021F61BA9|nr:leukocyte elastase inhibitor-like isoform X2 [Leptopilina boulardi]